MRSCGHACAGRESAAGWCFARGRRPLPLLATAFNLVIGGTEARWRLYGWRDPTAGAEIAWPAPVRSGAEKLSFDLIVPLRDEANVIGETLRGLLRQTHPRLHIVVSLCDDDKPTIDAV